MKINRLFLFLLVLAVLNFNCGSTEPELHVYLCFGQSNMEGQGKISEKDRKVNERFLLMPSVSCTERGRQLGIWESAVPPLSQCYTGLSPSDYFARTMLDNLPGHIRVGIINVAVGGCDIRLFDKHNYQNHLTTYNEAWFRDKVSAYSGNPYQHMVDLARLAQKDGEIKGILLHQGETNTGDTNWPEYVAKIYGDLISDLVLPDHTPILAGELVSGPDSCCEDMNEIIALLPSRIEHAHLVSSEGCSLMDPAHFDAEGYRELGRRYAKKMLKVVYNLD